MARVFAVVRQSDYKDGSLSLEEQSGKDRRVVHSAKAIRSTQVEREKDVSRAACP